MTRRRYGASGCHCGHRNGAAMMSESASSIAYANSAPRPSRGSSYQATAASSSFHARGATRREWVIGRSGLRGGRETLRERHRLRPRPASPPSERQAPTSTPGPTRDPYRPGCRPAARRAPGVLSRATRERLGGRVWRLHPRMSSLASPTARCRPRRSGRLSRHVPRPRSFGTRTVNSANVPSSVRTRSSPWCCSVTMSSLTESPSPMCPDPAGLVV